ncbi:MAG: pentapeptide repeat-containing protein [Vampirovibrio sp.]
MIEERQYRRVISTKKDLEELVRQALVSGVLDLENCKVDVDFNLKEILHASRIIADSQSNSEIRITRETSIECPFEIRASGAYFKNFKAPDFSLGSDLKLIFCQEVDFSGAIFKVEADFSQSVFKEKAIFSTSAFIEVADFFGVTFEKDAHFFSTSFTKRSDFFSVSFRQGAGFHGANFTEEAGFSKTAFSGDTDFSGASFGKHTSFKEIKFLTNTPLKFKYITLHDVFEIVPASLQGHINITSPQFEGEKSKLEVNFLNCDRNSKGSITFDDLKMDQDRIYITVRNLKEEIENVEIKFKTCNFYGKNISFKKVNNIDAVNFDDVDDISGFDFDLLKPTVLKRTIHMLWTFPFNRYQFQAIHKNTDEALKKVDMWASIYANLKAKADEKGERQLGNDYFFWQQYFQGKSPLKSTKHWVNSFYMNTSVYGLSYILPLVYFSLVLFFGGIFYNFLGDFTTVSITSVQKSFCSQIMVYVFEVKGYIVSISASLPFVFSDSKLVESLLPELPENAKRLKTGLFYFGYILQHLIQGYLLFQIGAAIRNKVKR